ncbi:5-formyltetrahydrofolate cyclo-ligase [Arthrobacter sp. SPG23]|uniref:5-formyltetrahydrofolate cyclo-ligase n=1 Tax=Arthrobacter sp. SPG23 TaxID=1610703 RepID=UPI0005B938B5|nr:5-formyltetrahydrofolate cyclo-ligase [Arthrobacter sp. SPG23]KIS26555.1 5-formyltetrahydrofolate cyclo-ligase [Arthrobacter sp. SPG23]
MPSKEEIRSAHRIERAAFSPAGLEAAGAGIARHGLQWAAMVAAGERSTFAAYLGVGFEPPTLPLLAALQGTGHRVLLPVCGPDRTLSWVFWTPETDFVRSSYAPIEEPVGEQHGIEAMSEVAGVFVPATAVDLSGNRIGQGGGYYDKFLSGLDAAGLPLPAAAVVFDGEVLPAGSIPAESFDRKVPVAVTPSRLTQLM